MAVDANTGITYDLASANREDLLDLITIISPTQTPFFSMVSKGSAAATLHEWLTDELTAHKVDAGKLEGDDAIFDPLEVPVRLKNVTQILTHPSLQPPATQSPSGDSAAVRTADGEWKA